MNREDPTKEFIFEAKQTNKAFLGYAVLNSIQTLTKCVSKKQTELAVKHVKHSSNIFEQ